jgi:hypothetical protein
MSTPAKKCACWYQESRECYRARYAPVDDLSRAEFFEQMDSEDLQCECVCHDDDEYEMYEENPPVRHEDIT